MFFDKILVANRGEIAVRIIKTCEKLGIATVAIYSEADARAPFVKDATESVYIGGARAGESYLNVDKIIKVALERGCSAVHPGYGFLSENAAFAERVADVDMVFIGPSPAAIRLLGDKMKSKELAIQAKVPVVPGYHEPLSSLKKALAIARSVGFPLLLKPAAGGGGRGMRIVRSAKEFEPALAACRDETRKSFADDRIFIERYIMRPRHIEIQVLADEHGSIIHLGERECSIQRRYQKVIEETPSPAVDPNPQLRKKMGKTACDLARAAKFTNAGTVEFILAPDSSFYFLEMNTRLQVEHPVTEMVTGLDLVEQQIRIAAGERLNLKHSDVKTKGWSIEARIGAEDPSRGFLPTTGMVTRYALPSKKKQNIRVDAGIDAGSVVTIFYDSLLAKVISWGANREEARKTLVTALNGYHIEGPVTNVDFVNAIINHPAFINGLLSTDFIEEHFPDGKSKLEPDPEHLRFMVCAACLVYHTRQNLVRQSLRPMSPLVGGAPAPKKAVEYVAKVDHQDFKVTMTYDKVVAGWKVQLNGFSYEVVTPEFEYFRRRLALKINGRSHMFRLRYDENHIRAFFCGIVRTIEVYTPAEWPVTEFMLRDKKEVQDNTLKCPMPGLVTAITVEKGEYVRKGQELLRMESMKMESGIASPYDAYIQDILVKPDDTVETDDVLMTFKAP
jgi:propionyl-CoA carboxylase alpha chain